MKKSFLTVSFLAFFGAAALAQGISGGLKAGLNLANQKWSGDGISLDSKSMVGFHGGFYLTVMFSEKMGLQPEVLYSAQGATLDFGGDYDIKFTYFSLPILFRYNINEMINIHAGPQFSFLSSAEISADGDTEDIKDSVKGLDMSGAIGAGIDLPMGLNFGARYLFGLSDVSDEDGTEIKNSNFQLYVGYRLFGK